MKLTGPQIISELRDKLQLGIGRHLYGVLGTYAQLKRFEQVDLSQARDPYGALFPPVTNLNRELLTRIEDAQLRRLIQDEAKYPQAVQRRLSQQFDQLLAELLMVQPGHETGFHFLILKQVELLFTYDLELSVLRTRAANACHILLLLPGQRRGEQIILFHEAEAHFHRTLPDHLIIENHLWELKDNPS